MTEKYGIYYDKPKENYKSYNDSSFVVGDSPIVLDIFAALSRETYNGEISCDGPGDILVALSSDGTNYGDNVLVKSSEILSITTHKIRKVKITHTGTDSSYRTRFW